MMHDHDLEDGIEFTTVNAKPTAVTHYTPSVKKQIKLDIEFWLEKGSSHIFSPGPH